MAMKEQGQAPAAGETAYGKVFRERGTMKLVVLAVTLFVLWYAWSWYSDSQMLAKQWPTLQPDVNGLTVLGLQDRERPGHKPKYIAIESNHSWQIRYRDDAEESGGEESSETTEESRDRGGSAPGSNKGTSRGSVVPLEELLRDCPAAMTGAHFTGAYLREELEPLFDRKYWIVALDLTPEGRSRYWQYSRGREKEKLVFLLKKEIITCAKMEHMNVGTLEISPIWVKADAQKLADFINKK